MSVISEALRTAQRDGGDRRPRPTLMDAAFPAEPLVIGLGDALRQVARRRHDAENPPVVAAVADGVRASREWAACFLLLTAFAGVAWVLIPTVASTPRESQTRTGQLVQEESVEPTQSARPPASSSVFSAPPDPAVLLPAVPAPRAADTPADAALATPSFPLEQREEKTPAPDVTRYRLTGVLYGGDRPLAVINTAIVGVGQQVEGATVLDIEPTRVTLRAADITFDLSLQASPAPK